MLKHLTLTNFRNYEKRDFDFARTTIFIGPNGIGKTNILEAIYLLSTGRSWRTNHDLELIKWQDDFFKIAAKIKNEDEEDLELIAQKPTPENHFSKSIKINGVKKRLADFLGKMPTVLFSPEELRLVDGAPSYRRRFLDILLCELDKKYTLALIDLAKIIKNRNKLLFLIKIGRARVSELGFWDEKLVTLGSFIIRKRFKAIEGLNLNLAKAYQEISGGKEELKIKYKPTVLPENYAEMLVASQVREIESTATLFGPHRDDFIFLLESKDITTFGSRGEFRSAILALKMAELAYLEQEKETKPILLLDDIFSELDKSRRLHLAKIVEKTQTIITTTDLDHIEKGLRESAKIVNLTH